MFTKRENGVIFTPTPDVAYVKTGGIWNVKTPVVSTAGILLALPYIHKVTPVNLKAFGVTIEKTKTNCLRSKDVFVDIKSVFTLQIDSVHIAKAVEQFGMETFALSDNSLIHNVLEGVLREVTATMTLDDLQEKRSEFTKQVTLVIEEKFQKLGLVLLNTSILTLEQTNIQFVNKEDILGARTSAITMQEIQHNRNKENNALREAEVLIQKKDTETDVEKIKLNVQLANQNVEAEKEQIEFAKSREIAKAQAVAEQEKESQTALINKDIAILQKNEERLKQSESLAKAQEKVNAAETNAETVRLKGVKEREKEIAIIDAQQEAESKSIQITVEAKARSEQVKIEAEAKYFQVELRSRGLIYLWTREKARA
jgi:flotillin